LRLHAIPPLVVFAALRSRDLPGNDPAVAAATPYGFGAADGMATLRMKVLSSQARTFLPGLLLL